MAFMFQLVSDVSTFLSDMDRVQESVSEVSEELESVGESADLSPISESARTASQAAAGHVKDLGRATNQTIDEIAMDAKRVSAIGDEHEAAVSRALAALAEMDKGAEHYSQNSAKSVRDNWSAAAGQVAETLRAAAKELLAPVFLGGVIATGAKALTDWAKAANEELRETKKEAVELGTALGEVDGNPAAIDWAKQLKAAMNKIVDKREWYEFWQGSDLTALEKWGGIAQKFGLDFANVARGLSGDSESISRALSDINAQISALDNVGLDDLVTGSLPESARQSAAALKELRAALEAAQLKMSMTDQHAAAMSDALLGMSDVIQDSNAATKAYESSVVKSLNNAGQSWQKYAKEGKIDLDSYSKAMSDQIAAVTTYEANMVTASKLLQNEALTYLRGLGIEAAPLLDAFIKAPAAKQAELASIWQKLGKSASDSYRQGADLSAAVADSIRDAQGVADGRPLRIRTALSAGNLARDVQTLVGGITVPTLTVRTRLGQSYQ